MLSLVITPARQSPSADGWEDILLPEIERQQELGCQRGREERKGVGGISARGRSCRPRGPREESDRQHRKECKVTERETNNNPEDSNALVQQVLRESYRQATEDLRLYAEKVRCYNHTKKALREYLAALRDFRAQLLSAASERGVELCRGDQKDLAVIAELFAAHARAYDLGERERGLCIPDRVPPVEVNSIALLDNQIRRWEDRLASTGDDAQLANIDLQSALQRQQQTLELLSTISESLHDTAMAIIRNLRG